MKRDEKSILNTVYKDDEREFTEEIREIAFKDLTNAFASLPFIRILKASNAKVESIAYFSDNFSWEDIIVHSNSEIGNFFNAEIRFECIDFDSLCRLLSTFPTSVMQHFELEQNYIFLPDNGYNKDEDALYTLKINVHPNIAVSKLGFRKFFLLPHRTS